jgi:uncharacterized protein
MISRRSKFAYIVMLFFILGCLEASSAMQEFYFVNGDGGRSPVISTELAQTESERRIGLMYRKDLPERSGMLFVFDDQVPRSFWMKNTYLELDMIFLNSQKEVVCVISRAAPLSEERRYCGKPTKFVLEIGGGLAGKWGIRVGSSLQP